MKKFLLVLIWAGITLPLAWSWNDEQYAKIKAAGAKNADTTTAEGVLLNTATKTADLALFYHLQGNDGQADLWLAVAWQDFQQVQAAPTSIVPATMPPAPSMTPAPTATPPATSPQM